MNSIRGFKPTKNFYYILLFVIKKTLGSDLACLTVYDISSDISCKYMYYVLNNSERGDAISSFWHDYRFESRDLLFVG